MKLQKYTNRILLVLTSKLTGKEAFNFCRKYTLSILSRKKYKQSILLVWVAKLVIIAKYKQSILQKYYFAKKYKWSILIVQIKYTFWAFKNVWVGRERQHPKETLYTENGLLFPLKTFIKSVQIYTYYSKLCTEN